MKYIVEVQRVEEPTKEDRYPKQTVLYSQAVEDDLAEGLIRRVIKAVNTLEHDKKTNEG